MKNNSIKKLIVLIISISILFISGLIMINCYQFNYYRNNYNNKIISIINELKEKDINIDDKTIIEILKSKNKLDNSVLKKYSIDINNDSIILDNNNGFKITNIIITIYILIFIIVLILIIIIYNRKKQKDINDIVKCIEQINKKNYKLNIETMSEDSLSLLKNEIYKTTLMLKEEAENSKKDKLELKDNLSDISHQLKTPLTSIMIMLDNLLEDESMSYENRCMFLRSIKREIININFLVQSILKLSKLDTNTVNFINEKYNIKDIIDNSIKNVSILSELKNIDINVSGDYYNLICDYKWQVEALTNILKNSIEHSNDNNKIDIILKSNEVYNQITIIDYGEGIDKIDLNHIFEKFYKTNKSSFDSNGIGLSLSKKIIEKNNGNIHVESNNNGTSFIIKYFK